MMAESLPVDLLRPCRQDHQVFPFRAAEQNAADDLFWPLAAFFSGLLERVKLSGMAKDDMGDAQFCQSDRDGWRSHESRVGSDQ